VLDPAPTGWHAPHPMVAQASLDRLEPCQMCRAATMRG
jgi:hypothetical protein